jgi:hypothetical protein
VRTLIGGDEASDVLACHAADSSPRELSRDTSSGVHVQTHLNHRLA